MERRGRVLLRRDRRRHYTDDDRGAAAQCRDLPLNAPGS